MRVPAERRERCAPPRKAIVEAVVVWHQIIKGGLGFTGSGVPAFILCGKVVFREEAMVGLERAQYHNHPVQVDVRMALDAKLLLLPLEVLADLLEDHLLQRRVRAWPHLKLCEFRSPVLPSPDLLHVFVGHTGSGLIAKVVVVEQHGVIKLSFVAGVILGELFGNGVVHANGVN